MSAPKAIPTSATGSRRRDSLGSGYYLAVVVHDDGSTWPVIVDERVRTSTRMKCAPEHWRGTIHDPSEPFEPRCGHRRSDGQRCRAVVARVGDACWRHRAGR